MSRTRIAFFSSRVDAEALCQALVRSGISARVQPEPLLGRLWFVPKAAAWRLLVLPEQAEQAGKLLLNWEVSLASLNRAVRCPECNSPRVEYPQFTQKSLLTNLAMGLMAEVGLIERDYYCEDCHFTWPKEEAQPVRSRAHMAPNYFIEGIQHPAGSEKRPGHFP
jgi:hypothetical protein